MNRIWTILICLLYSFSGVLGGCHPKALYEDAPQPPLETGREYEQKHRYAQAEQAYLQIDDIVVRNMTLNQLASAWDSVNANIIRAQKSVDAQPEDAKARLALARAYYHKGLLCSRYTKEARGKYPKDFLLSELDHYYSESLRQIRKAIRFEKDLPEAYLLTAEMYLANSLPNEALTELKRLIVKHPEYAKGYYGIGKIYLETGQYDKVRRYLVRSIKLDPEFTDAYYLLGKYFLDIHWYDYAAKTFLEILRKDPADTPTFDLLIDACHDLGNFYVDQGAYDQGIQLFQEILLVRSSYSVHQSLVRAKQLKAEAPLAAEEPAASQDTPPTQPVQQKTESVTAIEPILPPVEIPKLSAQETTSSVLAINAPLSATELRKTPAALSNTDIIQLIKQSGFHHPHNLSSWGLSGTVKGSFQHAYELQAGDGGTVVIDHATGLTWQKGGSSEQLSWDNTKAYIQQLNQENYAGYSDWRLPTAAELASLLEFDRKNSKLYIDPVFDATQSFCWTADTVTSSTSAWVVAFNSGHVYHDTLDKGNYIRAVR